MKLLKKVTALLLSASMILSLAACGQGGSSSGSKGGAASSGGASSAASSSAGASSAASATPKIDAIKKAGVLVVGTSADYPPYEFHTEIDGQDTIVGFDMAFAKYFADSLGVELKIVDMAFNGLLIGLSQGDFDLVLAGLTPDEERKKSADFTDVFFTNVQVVILRAEDAEKFSTTEALKGAKGGFQAGTVQEDIAYDVVGEENAVGLVKFQDLIMELQNKKIDALFTNSLIASAYTSTNDDLISMVLDIDYVSPGFAGAIQKGNEDLLEYLNARIKEMQDQGLIDQYIAEAQKLAGIDEE